MDWEGCQAQDDSTSGLSGTGEPTHETPGSDKINQLLKLGRNINSDARSALSILIGNHYIHGLLPVVPISANNVPATEWVNNTRVAVSCRLRLASDALYP